MRFASPEIKICRLFKILLKGCPEIPERYILHVYNTISIGWYMLLEHQVIWCQGEAAGPNHGARKAYTNRLSTWFAPKI